MHNFTIYKNWTPLFILLILSYFSLFHQLPKHSMHLWDESSYALNAQEMIERGNPIEVYLFGKPDLYNSKPPLAIWCMAISMKLLGFNELGVRLPSAIFSFLSVLLLFYIGIKVLKNYWFALLIPLVLLSSVGFVGEHVARTGDTDSILAFWVLLQTTLIFVYTNTTEQKKANNYLILAGIAISLGCLTKGIAGIIAIPGIITWLLYTKKLIITLQKKGFYIGVLFFLILVVGYYLLRNHLTPGYFNAVLENEIGGRLHKQEFLNQESLPFYYYFQAMIEKSRFSVWIFTLPLSIIYILMSTNTPTKPLGVFFIIIFISISIMLAISKTKLNWYDAPLYSSMAIIIGLSFYMFYENISKYALLLFMLLFIWPFYQVVSNNISNGKGSSLGKCIRFARNNGHRKDTVTVINADFNFTIYFYIKQDCLNKNVCFEKNPNDTSLQTGNFIITEKYERDIDVNRIFVLEKIFNYNECNYYKIISRR